MANQKGVKIITIVVIVIFIIFMGLSAVMYFIGGARPRPTTTEDQTWTINTEVVEKTIDNTTGDITTGNITANTEE